MLILLMWAVFYSCSGIDSVFILNYGQRKSNGIEEAKPLFGCKRSCSELCSAKYGLTSSLLINGRLDSQIFLPEHQCSCGLRFLCCDVIPIYWLPLCLLSLWFTIPSALKEKLIILNQRKAFADPNYHILLRMRHINMIILKRMTFDFIHVIKVEGAWIYFSALFHYLPYVEPLEGNILLFEIFWYLHNSLRWWR